MINFYICIYILMVTIFMQKRTVRTVFDANNTLSHQFYDNFSKFNIVSVLLATYFQFIVMDIDPDFYAFAIHIIKTFFPAFLFAKCIFHALCFITEQIYCQATRVNCKIIYLCKIPILTQLVEALHQQLHSGGSSSAKYILK